MTCSICQQSGHNRQTCSVVVRYEYDDCGVKCRINPNDEGDYQPVETYCLPCGAKTEECDCGKYKCGKWFNEEKGKFQGAPRRSSPRPKKITPKPACFACGQVETECRLEITAEGKTLCCDCLYIENHPDATCHRCDKKLYSKTLVLCGGGDGECETWYCATCHADGTHDCPVCGDDDETVSVVSEDTCECCGRPYDHRNPHRQSEMCDCVQNDDGTLSRPEEVPELPCPDCRRWFDEGKDNCKSCDFDLNSFNELSICEACGVPETDECRPDCAYQARRQMEEEEEHRQKSCYSPTRDQLIALGKYKLAKFQIGKSEQKDETNWNEDGDDELCSAIDASGNALY
jgi:hypothetical protein